MDQKDPSKLKELIGKTFVESGKQYELYNKTKTLLSECGWTEKVQQMSQGTSTNLLITYLEALLKYKDSISPQDLSLTIYKRAQGNFKVDVYMVEIVPDSIKGEILKDVHEFVQKCCE